MTDSINRVILLGNLAAEPVPCSLDSGDRACQLRIVTVGDKDDGVTSEWHTVMVESADLVDVVERTLHKGSKVHIEGCLRTEKTQGPDKQVTYTNVVVLKGSGAILDPFEDGTESSAQAPAKQESQAASRHHDLAEDIGDDNFPF